MIQIKSNAEVSPEAQKILKTGIGYRCEDQADDDYHYPKEVVAFEENELGNTDIGDTLLKFYNFKFKIVKGFSNYFVTLIGFKPMTHSLEGCYSIH